MARSKTLPRVRPTRRAVAFADRVDEQLDPLAHIASGPQQQQTTTRIGALALERPPSLLEAQVGAAHDTRSPIRTRTSAAGVTSTKANLRDGSSNGCAPDEEVSGRSTSRRWKLFRVGRTASARAALATATLAGLVALLLVRPSFPLPLSLPVPLALLLELCVRAPLALSLPLLVILSLASFSLLLCTLRILHR